MATETPELEPPREDAEATAAAAGKTSTTVVVVGVAALLLLLGVIGVLSYLMLRDPQGTQTLRDVLIVWIAFESLLVGAALIVLIVQLARLTNLLQNEIRPILEYTNETLSTVRGTALFVSENVTEPVVRISSAVAAVQRFVQLLAPTRTKRN